MRIMKLILKLLKFIFGVKDKEAYPPISEAAMARRAEIEYEILYTNPQMAHSEAYFRSIEIMEQYYGDRWWQRFGNTVEDRIKADKIRWRLNAMHYSDNFRNIIKF